jgi:hypothetical protein
MNSLAKLKTQLAELEDRKTRLAAEIAAADRTYKAGWLLAAAGLLLLAAYRSLPALAAVGLLAIVAGGALGLANGAKRARSRDELEQTQSEIAKLKLLMV